MIDIYREEYSQHNSAEDEAVSETSVIKAGGSENVNSEESDHNQSEKSSHSQGGGAQVSQAAATYSLTHEQMASFQEQTEQYENEINQLKIQLEECQEDLQAQRIPTTPRSPSKHNRSGSLYGKPSLSNLLNSEPEMLTDQIAELE